MNLSAGRRLALQLAGIGCIIVSLYLFFSVKVSASLRSSERDGEASLFYRQPGRQFNERNKCRFRTLFPENGDPVRICFSFHSSRPIPQFRLDPGEKPGARYRLNGLSIRVYGGLLEYRADTPETAARIEVNDQLVQDREKLPEISVTATGSDPQIIIPASALSRRLNLSAGSLICPVLFLLGAASLLAPGFLSRRDGKNQPGSLDRPA